MNWGEAIVLSIIMFIGFIGVVVFKAMREDISLTSNSYYEDELKYETENTKRKNFRNLPTKPVVESTPEGNARIAFGQTIQEARLKFYKPDHKALDFNIISKDTMIIIPLKSKGTGLWKLHLQFTVSGVEASHEYTLHIQ